MEHELIGLDRSPQLAAEGEPAARARIALLLVDLDSGSVGLGLVHRRVRALDERLSARRAIRKQRDADAGAERELDALELVGTADRRADSRGGGLRVLPVGIRQQDRELVAAEPGQHVDRSHTTGQAARHLLEQQVAGVVAERVV